MKNTRTIRLYDYDSGNTTAILTVDKDTTNEEITDAIGLGRQLAWLSYGDLEEEDITEELVEESKDERYDYCTCDWEFVAEVLRKTFGSKIKIIELDWEDEIEW